MSGSKTITADDDGLLDNIHPGDILREDFLIGSEVPVQEVALGAQIDPAVLEAVLTCSRDVDASLGARLTRYFGMSDGFFLRLQNSYDMEDVVRNEADALAKIVRRAA
ncbi:HigA family addiction module antitoxin [Sphingomonas jeddahensis]|uniref:HTH-type transcriptional regulator YbaQ n=1 Tax=Sphingomonas jeddahensis TaxID=1915074 RepID=A0A1V2EVT2_9SPHN|nr:HigA family addiction module antitoxin [Sphingomonas jeddahensis]ONF96653.1 hypothetical protein SPHI_08470 [Sphingomonas jeddahensis]